MDEAYTTRMGTPVQECKAQEYARAVRNNHTDAQLLLNPVTFQGVTLGIMQACTCYTSRRDECLGSAMRAAFKGLTQ